MFPNEVCYATLLFYAKQGGVLGGNRLVLTNITPSTASGPTR